jgi:hypothetical protein
MCKECIHKFCFSQVPGKSAAKATEPDSEGRCSKCDKSIRKKDVIDLKESGSAFASHSKVEATVVKPTFQS